MSSRRCPGAIEVIGRWPPAHSFCRSESPQQQTGTPCRNTQSDFTSAGTGAGDPLSHEHQRALTRWFDHYVSVLGQCGAVHPRDALLVTAPRNRPASIANRMAHEYRDLNEIELYRARKESPAARRARLARARDRETARLVRRLSATSQVELDALIDAARAMRPDQAIANEHLLAALLNDTFLRVIQLALVDDIAFARENM